VRAQPHDRQGGQRQGADERHARGVHDRNEAGAALLDLDVPAALALPAPPPPSPYWPLLGSDPPPPMPKRIAATGMTVTPSRSTGAPNTVPASNRAPMRSASVASRSSVRR
jgi:hypothetical protein